MPGALSGRDLIRMAEASKKRMLSAALGIEYFRPEKDFAPFECIYDGLTFAKGEGLKHHLQSAHRIETNANMVLGGWFCTHKPKNGDPECPRSKLERPLPNRENLLRHYAQGHGNYVT